MRGRVYRPEGLSPAALACATGGNPGIMVLDGRNGRIRGGACAGAATADGGPLTANNKTAGFPAPCAIRGRPDGDGKNKRRIEMNGIGAANAITTVQYDSMVAEGCRVRKLTPRECWRLMGFTDKQFDAVKGVSETQLYRQAGNGMAIQTLEAIFRRMFLDGPAGGARANAENQYEFCV
jgi:hypothetical protein